MLTGKRFGWTVAVLAAMMGFSGTAARAGLVSYWPFDDENANDVAGPNNAAVLGTTGFSSDVPGPLGGGFSMQTNANGDGALIAAPVGLNSSDFTLAMWINNPGQSGVVNRLTGRAGYSFETAVQDPTAFFGSGTQHALAFFDGSGWKLTPGVPTLGDWSHVAFVAQAGTMNTYLNGSLVDTRGTTAAPSGAMAIGAAIGGPGGVPAETMIGKFDDVAMWDHPLTAGEIAGLANGALRPNTIIAPPPPIVVGSNSGWRKSTVVIGGGVPGTWDPSSDPPPPAVATFTEAPVTTNAGFIPHINSAAGALGVEGLKGDGGVHYYRTTFNLPAFAALDAAISLAADNGAQIYINGQLVATETSYDGANWTPPYSRATIGPTGTVTSVSLFDAVAPSFTGWLVGQNEVIVALRNPDSEGPNSGGFAYRMTINVTPVPEPGSFALALAAVMGVGFWRAKARRREERRG